LNAYDEDGTPFTNYGGKEEKKKRQDVMEGNREQGAVSPTLFFPFPLSKYLRAKKTLIYFPHSHERGIE
jgi:hypothetical protein